MANNYWNTQKSTEADDNNISYKGKLQPGGVSNESYLGKQKRTSGGDVGMSGKNGGKNIGLSGKNNGKDIGMSGKRGGYDNNPTFDNG